MLNYRYSLFGSCLMVFVLLGLAWIYIQPEFVRLMVGAAEPLADLIARVLGAALKLNLDQSEKIGGDENGGSLLLVAILSYLLYWIFGYREIVPRVNALRALGTWPMLRALIILFAFVYLPLVYAWLTSTTKIWGWTIWASGATNNIMARLGLPAPTPDKLVTTPIGHALIFLLVLLAVLLVITIITPLWNKLFGSR